MNVVPAREWNAVIDGLIRHRFLGSTVQEHGGFVHPWTIIPEFDAQQTRWSCHIKPGYVNGLEATVSLPAKDVPQDTLDRLKASKEPMPGDAETAVEVWLTESPLMPLTAWRSIGPDASPTGSSVSEDGNVNFTFEQVPKFFEALGVGEPPKIGSSGAEGIMQSASGTAEDQASVRLMRALDIVLYQDRPATASQFTQSDGSDGVIFQYDVTVVNAPSARKRAYLRETSKYEPPPPPTDPIARLMGDWSDMPRDELWMASVYLVSPEGAAFGSAPDETWQPYVRHRVFWNLNHATNRLPPPLKSENLTLITGLAGGVGDRINQFLLSQVNDANNAVAQFLNRNTIEGRFWTI